MDQKEREEFYETPKIHGISTNDIRFMEADKLVNYTLLILYSATALAATYAVCTLGLLIGSAIFSIFNFNDFDQMFQYKSISISIA